jgi:hypothetical protein
MRHVPARSTLLNSITQPPSNEAKAGSFTPSSLLATIGFRNPVHTTLGSTRRGADVPGEDACASPPLLLHPTSNTVRIRIAIRPRMSGIALFLGVQGAHDALVGDEPDDGDGDDDRDADPR